MKFFILLALLLLNTINLNAWKMEADKITVDDNVAITTTFRQNYTSPPLVFILADSDGGDSASIRISSVTSIGFTAYMVEPEGNDGAHLRQEKISYIAIEAGTHTLPDGTKIAAGSVSTQRFQSKTLGGYVLAVSES